MVYGYRLTCSNSRSQLRGKRKQRKPFIFKKRQQAVAYSIESFAPSRVSKEHLTVERTLRV